MALELNSNGNYFLFWLPKVYNTCVQCNQFSAFDFDITLIIYKKDIIREVYNFSGVFLSLS